MAIRLPDANTRKVKNSARMVMPVPQNGHSVTLDDPLRAVILLWPAGACIGSTTNTSQLGSPAERDGSAEWGYLPCATAVGVKFDYPLESVSIKRWVRDYSGPNCQAPAESSGFGDASSTKKLSRVRL
jgi:hypothetical protein